MAELRPTSLLSADFGSRFAAFMIDAAILFVGQWIVFIVLSRQLQAVGLTSESACDSQLEDAIEPVMCQGPAPLLWVLLLALLVGSTVGYYTWFDGVQGATPGKRWMGVAVVAHSNSVEAPATSPDPVGFSLGLRRAVVRQAFWLVLVFVLPGSPAGVELPAVVFGLILLVSLWPVVSAAVAGDGRGAHDLLARTVVVRAVPVTLVSQPTKDT